MLLFILAAVFCIFPNMQEYTYNTDKNFNAYAEVFILCGNIVLISAIIEIFLILFIFPIEFFIYKFKKSEPRIIKIPDKFRKIHLIVLILGVLVSISPLIFSLYILT